MLQCNILLKIKAWTTGALQHNHVPTLLKTMIRRPTRPHNTSFVDRIAFRNALVCGSGNAPWIRACALASGMDLCFSGAHFECRNARGFGNRAAAGKDERKTGTL